MALVLAELEACSFRNKTPAETASYMKPLLDKYLPLSPTTSGSSALQLERQKDHYSHFILRLAFASTEDLRRRFSRAESMLFRLRFQADDLRDRQAFVESLGLDWETVTEDEKREYWEELKAVSGGSAKRVEEESYFKVDWEKVPELIENRRVFLKAGQAYVPSREQLSMVVAEFTNRLDKALEVCSLSSGWVNAANRDSSHLEPSHDLMKTTVSLLFSPISPKTSQHRMLNTRIPQLRFQEQIFRLATSTPFHPPSLSACRTSIDHSAVILISSILVVYNTHFS